MSWINSIALNIYQDGTEGLGPHFDGIDRFDRPITTVRLFSPSRLSFGCILYGTSNGQFTVPLPRGCICVIKKNTIAADTKQSKKKINL